MPSISVIVNRYTTDGLAGLIYGPRIIDINLNSCAEQSRETLVANAIEVAMKYVGKGFCVIVRPNYNEKDERGEFFREWRCLNGVRDEYRTSVGSFVGPFHECRWERI